MKEPNANSTAAASGVTPGVILKAARQEQGLSVVDVAARLCLAVQFIEDIERDDYSHMSARVYARGHVMAYAHLLGIPETQILPALVNVNMHFEPVKPTVSADTEQSIPIYQPLESPQQRSSLMLWGSILVLIILIGLVVLWWRGPSAIDSKTAGPAAENKSTEVQIQQPQTQPTQAAPLNAPAPAANPAAPLPAPVSGAPAPAAPANKPAQKVGDQTVLQPSEFRGNQANQDAPVALPPPRASNND